MNTEEFKEMALRYGTNKGKNDKYLEVYDEYFSKIKDLDFLYTREFFRHLVDARFTDLKSIHFYSGICVLVKS